MGFGDKFKQMREKAEDAVHDHKDQIQKGLEVAGAAVDKQTHGKHRSQIAKFGQKASDAVDKIAAEEEQERQAEAGGAAAPAAESGASAGPAADAEPPVTHTPEPDAAA